MRWYQDFELIISEDERILARLPSFDEILKHVSEGYIEDWDWRVKRWLEVFSEDNLRYLAAERRLDPQLYNESVSDLLEQFFEESGMEVLGTIPTGKCEMEMEELECIKIALEKRAAGLDSDTISFSEALRKSAGEILDAGSLPIKYEPYLQEVAEELREKALQRGVAMEEAERMVKLLGMEAKRLTGEQLDKLLET